MDDVSVRSIDRVAGEGGYVDYHVGLRTPTGVRFTVTFTGNIFVGPVILIGDEDGRCPDRVIDEPRCYGEFYSADWVRSFLAAQRSERDDDCEDVAG